VTAALVASLGMFLITYGTFRLLQGHLDNWRPYVTRWEGHRIPVYAGVAVAGYVALGCMLAQGL
jgi:hypothetical protein